MKKQIGFALHWSLLIVLLVGGTGFFVTRYVMSMRKLPAASRPGGLDNAMEQARQLAAALRIVDWNPHLVDQSLLRLPEQDFVQEPADRAPGRSSFSIPRQWSVYDEVAVYSDTLVTWRSLAGPGKGGNAQWEGYFVVAWMDGRVTAVSVADVRYVSFPGKDDRMFYVFPGMDEYETALTHLPGTGVPSASDKQP